MSYLDMRPVPPRDFVVEVESPRSLSASELGTSEVGREFGHDRSIRHSRFYSSPSLPHVWFEPVLVRRQMTPREIANRSQFFDTLRAERRTDIILISFFIFILFMFFLFFVLLFSGAIPFCNTM